MKTEIEKDPKKRMDYKQALFMTDAEKQVSFLNRYCVFKKVISVSKETMDKMEKQATAMYKNQEENVDPELESVFQRVLKEQPASRGRVRKLKVKLVLKKREPVETVPTVMFDMGTALGTALGTTLQQDVGQDDIDSATLDLVEESIQPSVVLKEPEAKKKPKLVIKGTKQVVGQK
jgi:hypothetical protein